MTPNPRERGEESWQTLHRLLEAQPAPGHPPAPAGSEPPAAAPIEDFLHSLSPADTARALSHLDRSDQALLLSILPPAEAAGLIHDVSDSQAAELATALAPERAAAIISELASDEQVDLLGEVSTREADAILGWMEPGHADELRALLAYPGDTAGGLMATEFLAYYEKLTAAELRADLRANRERYRNYDVQYIYVVDRTRQLRGILPLRDLLFAEEQAQLSALMLREPLHFHARSSLEEMRELFDERGFVGLPVTDEDWRIIGVVSRRAVEEALEEREGRTFLRVFGIIGGEEERRMALFPRARRRLTWLGVNILLNVLAASVIALHQETLAQVIALAVFLPIISDMSGNSGNQAIAVSLRELSLGLVKPRDLAWVLGRELSVGLINGAVLGTVLGLAAALWQQNLWFGLIVGGALAINTVASVAFGGILPLVLKRLRVDPALVASPLLTTLTDILGFLLALTFASRMIGRM